MTDNLTTELSIKSKSVKINRDHPTIVIGERINPTGRKVVLAALRVISISCARMPSRK